MTKRSCIVCAQRKGRRVCRLQNNKIICPVCCAQSRNTNCEGCLYYVAAKQYVASKSEKSEPNHFIAEMNEEVENTVNEALALAERGAIEKGEAIISDLRKVLPTKKK